MLCVLSLDGATATLLRSKRGLIVTVVECGFVGAIVVSRMLASRIFTCITISRPRQETHPHKGQIGKITTV